MWKGSATAFLMAWLVFGGAQTVRANLDPASDEPPALVSSYQQYNLKLQTFRPAPNRTAGLLLQARINGGRPLRMVLDSGAEFVVVAPKAARSLDLSAGSQIDLVGLGSKTANIGHAATLEIGPVSFRNCPVAVVDRPTSEGADGVIPLSLFSQFILRFDFPGKMLGLVPYPGQENLVVPPARGAAKHNLLLVPSVLNQKLSGYVVLDTGAFCSFVSGEVVHAMSGSPIAPEVPLATGTGAATGQLAPSAVHFAIARHDLVPQQLVAVDLSGLSRRLGVKVIGVLGFPELAHYILTVDYRHSRVNFELPQGLSAREAHRGGDDAKAAAALAFH